MKFVMSALLLCAAILPSTACFGAQGEETISPQSANSKERGQ